MHPGELTYHFVNTIIATALVAFFVLWRYRAGVLAGMRASGASELAIDPAAPPAVRASGASLRDVLAWERGARRRLSAAILAAVGLCAVPLGTLWLQQSGAPLSPPFVLVYSGGLLLAAIPMIATMLAFSWRRGVWLAVVLIVACAAAVVVVSMAQRLFTGRAPSVDQILNARSFLIVVASQQWLPLLLVLATGAPRIRGVAPMTFVGLLVFGLAPLLGSRLTAWLATTERGTQMVLDLGVNAAFIAVALPTGWVAWHRLRSVARAFDAKRLSESELLARVWWLMFCASAALVLVNATGRWLVPLAGATLVYLVFTLLYPRLVATVGLPSPRPSPRTLLLLRVFGYTARTERLFDRVGARWRLFGPVTMIAAPDVVARTVDPGDFLRFATGGLGDSFVTSRAALDARLTALDLTPDPDGRYRVNELCCQDNTWRATVVALMDRADAILMDLRGLTVARGGCEFELQQLSQRAQAPRIVLVVDQTTDREMVARLMGPAVRPATVTLVRSRDADTDQVFEALLEAGYC